MRRLFPRQPRQPDACSGSPVTVVKGRTAIEGLSGRGGAPNSRSRAARLRPQRDPVRPHAFLKVLYKLLTEIGEGKDKSLRMYW